MYGSVSSRYKKDFNPISGEVIVRPKELKEHQPFRAMLQVDITTGERIIDRREEVYWR